MALPTGLNDLVKLTLLASDESYFSSQFPVPDGSSLQPLPDTPSYNIFPQYDIVSAGAFHKDTQGTVEATGFKFIAFRNDATNEVIVAFGGTDGPNPQDWAANVEHLGWNQWNEGGRAAVFNYVNGLRNADGNPFTGKIHFTGQSLGGALAQYATYEYVRNRTVQFRPEDGGQQNPEFDPSFDKSLVTLTTFNAFGGQLGLERNTTGFNSTLLTGLGASAHFVIDGDLVSRLGGGHVGGPVYQLDYLSARINPDTSQPYFLNAIDGHRIETGFYANLSPLVTFDEAKLLSPQEVSGYYLPMASLQKISALLGNILNGKDVSPAESIPRLLAGMSAGLAFGDQGELNTLVKVVLKNFADAGTLTPTQYIALNAIRFGAVRPLAGAVYPITLIAAGLVDAAQLGLSGVQSAYQAVKQFLGLPETAGPSAPTSLPAHTFFEKMKAFFSFIPEVLSANESISSAQLARLNLDLNQYAQVLLDNTSSTWRTDTLAWLRTQATGVDFQPAEIDQLMVAFYNSLSTIPGLEPAEMTLLAQERDAFITETASGFANAISDFTQKITNVAFNLGQTISSFADIQLIDQAYAAELSDSRLSPSVKTVIEDARAIVQQAGQTVVVQAGIGANPFNGAGFNPDTIPPAAVNLNEGQLQTISINLPFKAGPGGQRVQLAFSGPNAGTVALRMDGAELTGQNGAFMLTIPEGQRQLMVGVRSTQDITVNSMLTVSATLLDANNVATHTTHLEANVALADTGELASSELPIQGPVEQIWTGTPGDDDLSSVGFLGNHSITAGLGNDYVDGWAGDDLLLGEGGADFLLGGQGRDVLEGGEDIDRLEGDGTPSQHASLGLPDQDYLDGGAGDDLLLGFDYDDVLIGGEGADQLLGDDYPATLYVDYPEASGGRPVGDDYLDGEAGADLLFGGLGNDLLLGGEGNDELYGDNVTAGGWYEFGYFGPSAPVLNPTGRLARFTAAGGADYLDGGAGSDILIGEGGEDILLGGTENDFLFGDDLSTNTVTQGADWLEGGAGDDQLLGGGGTDALFGGDGNDLLAGDFANDSTTGADDTLDGGTGDDQLHGGGGHDLLEGGLGNDLLMGEDGDDSLYGGEGLDQLQGGLGNDVLDGEAGNDLLFGGDGLDVLFGGDGSDELQGGSGDDDLAGEAGDDFLLGDAGHDTLSGDDGADRLQGGTGNDLLGGDAGNDVLFGEEGADSLFGDDGDDVLNGGEGSNTLVGGDGHDQLFGGSGEDRLEGGAGNDLLVGGGGADTIVYDGQGQDVLAAGVGNILEMTNGLTPTTTLASRAGNDLIFAVRGMTNRLTLQSFFANPSNQLQEVRFADSTIWDQTMLFDQSRNIVGTEGADTLTAPDDLGYRIQGLGDNDVLTGRAGIDTLEGGGGLDTLLGGEGSDTLIGGTGDDQLLGGEGADIYRFNLGDGFDSISDSNVAGEESRVVFGPGITSSSVMLTTTFGQVVVRPSAANEGLTIGANGSDVLGPRAVDRFEFADGSSITYADLVARGFDIDGTALDDQLFGTNVVDRITGGAGNDRLEGNEGDDRYFYNQGDGIDMIVDIALAVSGNEVIFDAGIAPSDLHLDLTPDQSDSTLSDLLIRIGAGGDAIQMETFDRNDVFGPRTIEIFRFADGSTLPYDQLLARGFDLAGTAGDDQLNGTNITDRIVAGDGADVLRSGAGDDALDGGTGDDRLVGGQGNDTYVFEPGSGQDTIVESVGNLDAIRMGAGVTPDEVVGLRNGNDLVLTLPGSTDRLTLQNFYLHSIFHVEQVLFEDGTQWDHAQILASTAQTITGTDGADVLQGNQADDTLRGLGGDDTLIGFAGEDVLDGGGGVDTMAGGSGNDTYVIDDATDIVLEVVGEGTDTVQSAVTCTLGLNVEHLTLIGGASIDGSGNELDNVLIGNVGANVLSGGAGKDTYVIGVGDTVVEQANEGIDTIVTEQSYAIGINVENLSLTGTGNLDGTGNALENVLIGNDGVNVLTGGLSNDTYVIGVGDTVVEQMGEGTDTVVTDQNYALGANVENLTLTGNQSFTGTGNELDNVLLGNAAASLLKGRLGNDTYVVGLGDSVVELVGEGIDTIQTAHDYTLGVNVENLTLLDAGPTLDVNLTAGTGALVEVGPSANFSGTGNNLENVLTGNRAGNALYGGDGQDVLDGRAGNDMLNGGAGADTYLFGVGSGNDRIEDESVSGEIDIVRLGPSLLPNEIGVVQSGLDLVLRMPGSQDELRLSNFFASPTYAMKAVRFEDGTVWDEAMLRMLGADPGPGITLIDNDSGDNILVGTIGHDVLRGGGGSDTLLGDGGNDILRDGAGHNLYDGGAGDDSLIGGGGNDRFMFGRGYGHDVVLVDQSFNDLFTTDTDQVQMVGLNPSDVTIQQSSASGQLRFTITVLDTADQLLLQFRNGIYGFAPAPVTLMYADGTSQELGLFTTFPAAPLPTVLSSVDYALGVDEENLVLVDIGSSVVPGPRVGIGNGLDNVILGNTADNVLDGSAGNDVLNGGFARSVETFFFVDTGSDILIGGEGNDILLPFGDSAFAFDFGVGTDPNPFNTPDDVLLGGSGNDTYYIQHAAQILVELTDEGIDTVRSTVTYTLPDNFENLVLLDPVPVFDDDDDDIVIPPPPLNGTGNDLDNFLIGSAKGNALTGGAGSDTLWGGNAIDLDSGVAASGNDILIGGSGNDTYLFNVGDEIDTIEDIATADEGNRIQFGEGITQNDLTFTRDDAARTLTIQVGTSGTDRLLLTNFDPTGANGSLVAQTLAFSDGSTANLAALLGGSVNHAPTVAAPLVDQTVPEDAPFSISVPATTFADEDAGDGLSYSASLANGNALPTWLSFDATSRTFSGTPDDAQIGSLDLRVTTTDTGNLSVSDVFSLTVTNVNEAPTVAAPLADQQATEDAVFNFVIPTTTFADVDSDDVLTYSATLADGTALPAWLSFNSTTRAFSGTPLNSDVGTLALRVTATDQGSLSASTDFTLAIQNVNDAPTVAAPLADQTVAEDSAFALTIPTTTFTDEDVIHGDVLTYGATLADGSPLPAWLSFNLTTRTLSGTPGVGDASSLQIAVAATDTGNLSATDTFALAISGPLPQNVIGTTGNDLLTGGRGNDTLTGLAGNDTLNGGQGHDLLDGGTGTDTMQGGTGNDTYIVDVTGDVVTELANEGTDTVQSSLTYTLGANVENLTLTGTANLNGAGNALDNILTGNSGINVLTGGAGNDTYVVSARDTVVENAGGGADTVQSSVAWTLSLNVENLTLTGTANINGTGSSANNVLVGNSGNNTLNSGSGNDTVDGGDGSDSLLGGSGDDTLLGGLGNDTLNAGSGNDVLNGGDGTDTLDGGSGDDQLLGGAGNDALIGGSGADQFTGGTGNDTLTGGSGNDLYNFSRGDGQDTIIDSDPFPGNQDRALFGATINPLDLVISRQANDLRLAIHGSSDQITVQNWHVGTNNRIETIQAGNGQTLLSTQVDQLIQAMAGFTQQTGLTWDQAIDQRPQDVQTILAASWQ